MRSRGAYSIHHPIHPRVCRNPRRLPYPQPRSHTSLTQCLGEILPRRRRSRDLTPRTAHPPFKMRYISRLEAAHPVPFLTRPFGRWYAVGECGSSSDQSPQEFLALVPTHFDLRTPRDALKASHVCRYWRFATISSPALWRATDTTRMIPFLIQLYLDRSRASPLDVTLGAETPEHMAIRGPCAPDQVLVLRGDAVVQTSSSRNAFRLPRGPPCWI